MEATQPCGNHVEEKNIQRMTLFLYYSVASSKHQADHDDPALRPGDISRAARIRSSGRILPSTSEQTHRASCAHHIQAWADLTRHLSTPNSQPTRWGMRCQSGTRYLAVACPWTDLKVSSIIREKPHSPLIVLGHHWWVQVVGRR